MLNSAKGKNTCKTHGKYRALIRSNIEADIPKQMKKLHKVHWLDVDTHESAKPLYNFLFSKIGQKWDNIYSELKRDLNPYENHVLKYHLGWMIKKVEIIDDIPFYNGFELTSYNGSYRSFYVDNDNILKISKIKHWNNVNHENKNEIKISDNYSCRRYNGIWYLFYCSYYKDAYGKKRELVHSKKQLNTKEIKHLQLNEGKVPSLELLKKLGFVNKKAA